MKINVLAVDDNQNNLLTIDILLEGFKDVEVLTASNGQEAIEICKQQQIHIIFMDIMMPVMDGIEATKVIRSFNKKVLIIAITALDDEVSKDSMLRNGAEDYVVKPIDSIVFKKRFEKYLELIEYRYQSNYDNKAINLFNKNVYNRSLVFRIFDKISLAEFWEYFLTDSSKGVNNLADCIKLIYVIGEILIKSNQNFQIIKEENDTHLYITLNNLDMISDTMIKRVILNNYPDLTFATKNHLLSFVFIKNIRESIPLSEVEEDILRSTHDKGISAKEFLLITPLNIMDKIDELESIEDKIDLSIIEFEKNPEQDRLAQILGYISIYNSVIEELIEFKNLSIGINSLIKFLDGIKVSKIKEHNTKLFTSLLLSVLEDLSNWRKTIFIEQNAKDIHYLDSSLLNSCLQIENILEDRQIDNEENDLELF